MVHRLILHWVTGSGRQPVAIIGKAIELGFLFVRCLNRLIAAKR